MKDLPMFGFPVVFDPADDRLVPGEGGVSFLAYSRKFSKGMFGLLADASYHTEDDPYYDFYKSIGRDSERARFEAVNLRYDSTVILAGAAGEEFKKTAGHFHCQVPGEAMSYPEYYQVIKGKALFVMQKVASSQTSGRMLVEDAVLAEVNAGEAIVIPPEYGHCTINISDETMVFVNLVSCDSENDYDGVKRSVGMCCYALRSPDGYRIQQNPGYDFACTPRVVTPKDSAALGVAKGAPVYTAFLASPDAFAYLNHPHLRQEDYLEAFQAK